MRTALMLPVLTALGAATALAQDPVKLSPQFYQVLLDNEHVRVLEFHAKAGDKEPMHYHPAGVVYVQTSGKARFTTPGGRSDEREFKAGTVLWADSVRHGYEYLGPGRVRVLIVEMKGLGAAGASETTPQRDDVEREIIAAMRRFERWLEAGEIDSLGTLVTDDYQALAPNQPTVVGKAGWLEWTRGLARLGRWTEQLTSESLQVSGPLAVQRGRYSLQFTPGPDAPSGTAKMSDTGKFLWHWTKVGDRWLLAAAAWSSDAPPKP